jgi:hypothetical protein
MIPLHCLWTCRSSAKLQGASQRSASDLRLIVRSESHANTSRPNHHVPERRGPSDSARPLIAGARIGRLGIRQRQIVQRRRRGRRPVQRRRYLPPRAGGLPYPARTGQGRRVQRAHESRQHVGRAVLGNHRRCRRPARLPHSLLPPIEKRLPVVVGGMNWWTAWDSNPRPPRCERGALPTELAAH